MHSHLSPEQAELASTIRRFAEKELAEGALKRAHAREYPWDVARKLAGMGLLYFVPIPEGNREPLMLALGLVLGWGSTVIGYEFGSSPAGRKAAQAGVRTGPEMSP